MSDKTRNIINALPESVTVAFAHAAGAWSDDGFLLENSEAITSHKIQLSGGGWEYDFPEISAERLPEERKTA